MDATGGAPARGAAPKGMRAKLLREPLFWAAVAAFVGATVGLVGTFSLAFWLGDTSGGTPQPPTAALATPLGKLLTTGSLAGVYALTDAGSGGASRIARIGGVVLLLALLCASLAVIFVELGWILLADRMMGGSSPLFALLSVSFFASLVLPCVVVVPLLLVAFSSREVRIGTILVGLCVSCVPFLLAWQVLSDGVVGEIPERAPAIVLLGGLGVGVSLPAAPLWILLGAAFLRRARARSLGEAFRLRERENLRAARRLYEEGLSKGDFSVLDGLVSEDFRDPGRGSRGRLAMERVFSDLWRSYPDLAVSIEEQEVEGDHVRTRLLLSGTDGGGVLWYPPTGRRVAFAADFVDRFSDGRLVEHTGRADTGGLLRQLGLEERRSALPPEKRG